MSAYCYVCGCGQSPDVTRVTREASLCSVRSTPPRAAHTETLSDSRKLAASRLSEDHPGHRPDCRTGGTENCHRCFQYFWAVGPLVRELLHPQGQARSCLGAAIFLLSLALGRDVFMAPLC